MLHLLQGRGVDEVLDTRDLVLFLYVVLFWQDEVQRRAVDDARCFRRDLLIEQEDCWCRECRVRIFGVIGRRLERLADFEGDVLIV